MWDTRQILRDEEFPFNRLRKQADVYAIRQQDSVASALPMLRNEVRRHSENQICILLQRLLQRLLRVIHRAKIIHSVVAGKARAKHTTQMTRQPYVRHP
jgi:hypothetical protein